MTGRISVKVLFERMNYRPTLVHIFAKYWQIFTILSHLRWGGIFINNFITQLFQLSTSVKESRKSVNI